MYDDVITCLLKVTAIITYNGFEFIFGNSLFFLYVVLLYVIILVSIIIDDYVDDGHMSTRWIIT